MAQKAFSKLRNILSAFAFLYDIYSIIQNAKGTHTSQSMLYSVAIQYKFVPSATAAFPPSNS
eukprot:3879936-Rhodomonas_salina.2